MSKYQRVGDWMVEKGLITTEQRDQAIKTQKETSARFGEVLIALGYASEATIVNCRAEQYDLPVCHLDTPSTPEALATVTSTFALAKLVLPTKVDERGLHIAICDPLDIQATDYIARQTGKRLVISVAGPAQLFEAIAKNYALPARKPNLFLHPHSKLTHQAKATSKTKSPRKPKIDPQPDRKELLAAIVGKGSESLWDAD